MTQEEKAKAYDEALKKAKDMLSYKEVRREDMEYLFPELKESEDERIRKDIVTYLKSILSNKKYGDKFIEDWIAWLEKQGEQKHTPKYKLGDTIYYNSFGEVKSMVVANVVTDSTDNLMYEDKDGNSVFQNDIVEQKPADKVEPKFKIGQIIKKEGFNTGFTIAKIEDDFYYNNVGDYFPITDQDNWELVEQKPDDNIESMTQSYITPNQKFFQWIYDRLIYVHDENPNVDYMLSLKERIKDMQKPAWSEEDEGLLYWTVNNLEEIKSRYGESYGKVGKCRNWVLSLKDRVQPQPKQEWSEEDRRHIEKLILNVNAKECPDEVDWLISLHEKIAPPYWDKEDEEMLNQAIQEVEYALNDKNIAFSGRDPVLLWLKHLRPQNRWKPSVEQMNALNYVVLRMASSERTIENDLRYNILKSLRQQLKKLRRE